jgi:hypothetical protein
MKCSFGGLLDVGSSLALMGGFVWAEKVPAEPSLISTTRSIHSDNVAISTADPKAIRVAPHGHRDPPSLS